jgi:hypothetical protein|tara:strand:- start:591 stop:839 length:249 start_codon:yes stop_codon:yes gene_type:complete
MAKKEKEKKPVLNLDGKEYIIEDMTDEQKELAGKVVINQNHVNDIQNKLNTNAFMREQLVECEKVFVSKFDKSVKELKEALD